jgi:hypothetical protein
MAAIGNVLEMLGRIHIADAQARLTNQAGAGCGSAVKRACHHRHLICRGMNSRRKGNGPHQSSAKYCTTRCPKIVTPYIRRREINRPDHVAAFKVAIG